MPINSRGRELVEVPADSVEAMANNTTLADLARIVGEMRRDLLALQDQIRKVQADSATDGIVAWLSDLESRMGSHTHEYASATHTHTVSEVTAGSDTKATSAPVG